jgi:hypothetical protein
MWFAGGRLRFLPFALLRRWRRVEMLDRLDEQQRDAISAVNNPVRPNFKNRRDGARDLEHPSLADVRLRVCSINRILRKIQCETQTVSE